MELYAFCLNNASLLLFVRCLVANFVAAAVDVVVIIIVPPLPFVIAILVIDDILLFCYLNKWHCLHVVCALLRSSSSSCSSCSSSCCCCCFNDCSAFAVRECNV